MKTIQNVIKQSTQTHLSIKLNSEIIFIPTLRILYIRALGRNSVICFKNKSLRTHISLKEYPEFLFTTFFRCHNSIIVNCRHVKSVADSHVNLDDATKIKLSRKRKSELQRFIEQAPILLLFLAADRLGIRLTKHCRR